ncbi:hypothetical protein Tco_0528643 [Tanacetum coccineum]
MNKKNYSFDLETFKDMLLIFLNLLGQKFEDPLFEEEILDFIRELGYHGNMKSLSNVKVETLPQPWRTFKTIINKCLSGKVTRLDLLHLVYRIENKEAKKNKYMYYPRFTKVIINHFMSKDRSILRRNKVDWHMANDDPILTTMRFIPKHETVQKYGAILPDALINQAMKESDAYKTYYDLATGKVAKSGKNKLPTQGLETLLEIALSKAEQMKIVTKRSKTQFYSSHASGSGANKGTGVSPGVPDVPTYEYKDEHISWKSSDEDNDDEVSLSKDDDDNDDDENNDGQDDDDEQTKSDNDGDEFVHPKFSTHDEKERQYEEDKEEKGLDMRVQTPSHFESTNDEAYNEVTQGDNVEGEELDEEETNEEEEVNELYTNVNINLKGRDTEMTDALQTNQSSSISSGFISNMLNPNPDTVPTPKIILSTSLQNLPNFGYLFNFEDSVKSLEDNFSEFKQTNPCAEAVSLIPGIVDKYIANQMNEAVKVAVQLQSVRLREEAQAKNEAFINKIDENMKKIIKNQVKVQVKEQVSKILLRIKKSVNEHLEVEVLIRLSNEAKTSHNKTLYKALVDAYEADNDILETYGDTVTNKIRQDDEDEDEEPFAGSNWGSKRRRVGKEPESTSAPEKKTSKSTGKSKEGFKSHQKSTGKSAQIEEPIHTVKDLEELALQEFDTGFTEDRHVDDTTQHPDWFQKPSKPPTPDRDWNKTLPDAHGPVQPWINNLARKEDPRKSFNELMDTPLDFSAFVLNRLKVDTLAPELLAGPIFELMKGSCKSLVELEYFLEEVCKATTDQLDYNNPEGLQYPHDLHKPLPLIINLRGHRVKPFDHFINNDLAYLSGGVSNRTYATSITKTKAADYGHIKWIKYLVLNLMWSQVSIVCDKHALWGISHWGRKRQQFYGYSVNKEFAHDVYSDRLVGIKKLTIVEWHNYKHLEWITVCRDDDKLYTFKEGDYNRLCLQDIEDMLLLLVQGKLTNLNIKERRVEDLQLGIESYHKKLNLTRLDTYRSNLKRKSAYTAYSYPKGFIYQNKDKKNRLMRIDELHKFSDGTLNDVRSTLDDILKRIRMKNRRLMRSLEKFIGERLYGGVFGCWKGPYDLSYDVLIIIVIMEYMVNISKRCAFWSLNEDILRITILKTNTPYPSRRYGVSMPALIKDHKGMKLNTPKDSDSGLLVYKEPLSKLACLELGVNALALSDRHPTYHETPSDRVNMDNPNITMEEYIRLAEERARKRGKVFNWETATYGKIWDSEDVHDLGSVETKFPAIVFNDKLTSEAPLSCEPTVSSLNDEIDFRVSFDESDAKDYTIVFDKNLFSYKKISTNDLKMDLENDNEKVMPLFPSPEPSVSYFDDLDFFKDFENEFPAIVYNDAQTSKSDLLTEPIFNPQHIDVFNLKDKKSLSEYDEEEQNVLNFNDLFPFNVIYPNNSKSDKDNDDDKVNIEHSLGDLFFKPLHDVINTDVGPQETEGSLINRRILVENLQPWRSFQGGCST